MTQLHLRGSHVPSPNIHLLFINKKKLSCGGAIVSRGVLGWRTSDLSLHKAQSQMEPYLDPMERTVAHLT